MLKRVSLIVLIIALFSNRAIAQTQELTLNIIQRESDSSIKKSPTHIHFSKTSSIKEANTRANTYVDSLRNIGYINSRKLGEPITKNDTLIYSIETGSLYRYILLQYYKDETKNDSPNQKTVYKDTTVLIETAFAKAYIEKLQSEQESPFTQIQLSEISIKNDSTLKAIIGYDLRKTRTIDKVVIKGYDKMPVSFLKHYARIRTKEDFSAEQTEEKATRLNTLPFVKLKSPPEVLFTKDSTQVYIPLEKIPANTFDGVLGFQTNSLNGKLEPTGYLNLSLINNLNYGEELRIQYRNDGSNQSAFDLEVNTPYILGTPAGINYELHLFRQDSAFANTSHTLTTNLQVNNNVSTGIFYRFNSSTNLSEQVETSKNESFKKNEFGALIIYTLFQDKILNPVKSQAIVSSSYGRRNTGDITTNQLFLKGDLTQIFNINTKNSFYLHSEIQFLDSENYLFNELIRTGGINSIRGFNENTLIGNTTLTLQTEYRYTITPRIYLNTIIDLGYIDNELFSLEQNLYSFGLGAAILSNNMLFRLSYANGNMNNQDFKISNSRLHINVISRF